MSSSTLKKDALTWVLAMLLAAAIAFVLLWRDSHRHFGAVSFGSFPSFSQTTLDGRAFNDHGMKSKVWAVLRMGSPQAQTRLHAVDEVQRMTRSGKRALYVLTFGVNPADAPPLDTFHFRFSGMPQSVNEAFNRAGAKGMDAVLLLDQDAIIRGIYDLSSPDDFRSFRADVMRLL